MFPLFFFPSLRVCVCVSRAHTCTCVLGNCSTERAVCVLSWPPAGGSHTHLNCSCCMGDRLQTCPGLPSVVAAQPAHSVLDEAECGLAISTTIMITLFLPSGTSQKPPHCSSHVYIICVPKHWTFPFLKFTQTSDGQTLPGPGFQYVFLICQILFPSPNFPLPFA